MSLCVCLYMCVCGWICQSSPLSRYVCWVRTLKTGAAFMWNQPDTKQNQMTFCGWETDGEDSREDHPCWTGLPSIPFYPRVLLWSCTERGTPSQICDVLMLSLSSHGLLICSSYSFLGVFILLSLIWIITLFSLSADARLHACTFCMLIKEKSVFLSALLNHCVCRRIYIRFFFNHFISQFLTVWFSLIFPLRYVLIAFLLLPR